MCAHADGYTFILSDTDHRPKGAALRERFDAGIGFMGLGAVILLVSLFIDWYEPGVDAWAVFEWVDVFLAGVALAVLATLLSRRERLPEALVLGAFAVLAVVAVQIVDLPPAVRGSEREAGAWLALGASTLMAIGAALSTAEVSVSVDVRGRERRRRTAAIDARETASSPAGDDPQRTQSLDPIDPASGTPGDRAGGQTPGREP